MMRRPKVFTIPAGVAFVDAIAARMLADSGSDPLALARCRILLPTRRACRALALAFLRLSGQRPLLLPRMTPIGDVDDDELTLEHADAIGENGDFDVPPAIASLRRQLLLTRLILALRGEETSPDQAARLAHELARFVDQVQIEGCDWRQLAAVVPEEFARHWQITLEFLKIVTEQWPAILAEEGRIDPADRRNRLLAAQAEAWTRTPPTSPVIAAGSTGSVPASADLLKVVSTLPQGAVVLPGLDLDTDAATWEIVKTEPWHPQFGMSQLLERLGIERRDVLPWPHPSLPATSPDRTALITRALRPATSAPAADTPISPQAMRDVTRIELQRPEEEARTIALLMRQTLEEPDRTAALVTPDRILARRVAAELQRWNIAIDDSAGVPLGDTLPGGFLRLVAAMVAEAYAPLPLLAALKHPLAAGGMAIGRFRRAVRRLERDVLRGPRPAPGLSGLRGALDGTGAEGMSVVDRLTAATASFAETLARDVVELDDAVRLHVAAAEALAETDGEKGAERLWLGEAGEALAEFVTALSEAAKGFAFVRPEGYPAFFDTLLSGHVVRPRWGRHPRLAIWGPLEARLQHADVMILGGLNEESWPPRVEASPWMSRPMLKAFGLPLPERRLGLSAHDFCQAFSAPEVWLTRSRRKEGSPTVPSRWLLRLEAELRSAGVSPGLRGGEQWIVWQAMLDRPRDDERRRIRPPAPSPPVAVRPRRLSVTQIETWMRDPYSIYAKHVLGLKALEPLDADPTLADYGSFVHKALELFVRRHPQASNLDEDQALQLLLTCGREAFAPMLHRPGVRAFWWPRFEGISRWYLALERARDADVTERFCEIAGSLDVAAPAGNFNLTAKADRIDRLANGAYTLIDYKTGRVPKPKELAQGFAPQLPLEAAIAMRGGFKDVPPLGTNMRIESLEFWQLCGNEAGGKRTILDEAPETAAATALAGLHRLVAAFDRAATGYELRPRPSVAPRYSDYEHLARIKEWSAGRCRVGMIVDPSTMPASVADPAGRQRQAADPLVSAWVGASAGTGKTKVLTDRVLSLMLSGTKPHRILCLTFTRAAAAEMNKRIADQLSAWVTMAEPDLARDLESLLGRPADSEERALARQLFALVLDLPGGMNIQTIHAFCQSLLSRFPLEAAIAPHFEVADARDGKELLSRATQRVLEAAGRSGQVVADALADLVRLLSEARFALLIDALVCDKTRIEAAVAAWGSVDAVVHALNAYLGVQSRHRPETIVAAACADTAFDARGLGACARALAQGSARDAERGEAIRRWLAAPSDERARLFKDYSCLFLTKDNRTKNLATKAVQSALAEVSDILRSESERLAEVEFPGACGGDGTGDGSFNAYRRRSFRMVRQSEVDPGGSRF